MKDNIPTESQTAMAITCGVMAHDIQESSWMDYVVD